MRIYPFRDGDTFGTFRNVADKVTTEIQSLDNEYVLKASQAELEDYCVEKVTVSPLILHTDQYYMEGLWGRWFKYNLTLGKERVG